MRQRLTAVFAAIVTAFVALDLVVVLSLWPQLHRLEALSTQFAANTTLIARMRGDLHVMRSAAAQRHVRLRAGSADGTELAELERARLDFAAAAKEFGAAAQEYDLTPMPQEEVDLWATLSSEAFPRFVRLAERAVGPVDIGETPDLAELRDLQIAAADADRILQELSLMNARGLDARGEEIHSTVTTLVVVCLALGALGIVGGILLVRWALGAVREYERSMQERLEELDQFAGRVAHDLRNPLQAMGMSLSLIQRRAEDERMLATCAKAQEGVKRMSEFIQELLTFARSGAKPAPDASAQVEEVVKHVQQDLSPLAEAKAIRLVVQPCPVAHAAISPEALRGIIANLVDNAMKHMPPGGAERRVEISSRAGHGEVEIVVRDTGAGISPEALPRIFDPFYRATQRTGGFGIGLKTVKRLVDAHGGRLLVDTEVGRGSAFTVILPAAAAPPAAAQPQASAGDARS
jgi:signal transduction histidine kinase